jgi:hypothetical protein
MLSIVPLLLAVVAGHIYRTIAAAGIGSACGLGTHLRSSIPIYTHLYPSILIYTHLGQSRAATESKMKQQGRAIDASSSLSVELV